MVSNQKQGNNKNKSYDSSRCNRCIGQANKMGVSRIFMIEHINNGQNVNGKTSFPWLCYHYVLINVVYLIQSYPKGHKMTDVEILLDLSKVTKT